MREGIRVRDEAQCWHQCAATETPQAELSKGAMKENGPRTRSAQPVLPAWLCPTALLQSQHRPPRTAPPRSAGERFQKVKLQRAEPALIKTVPGLFASVLYVDNLHSVGGQGAGRAAAWQPALQRRVGGRGKEVGGSGAHLCLTNRWVQALAGQGRLTWRTRSRGQALLPATGPVSHGRAEPSDTLLRVLRPTVLLQYFTDLEALKRIFSNYGALRCAPPLLCWLSPSSQRPALTS